MSEQPSLFDQPEEPELPEPGYRARRSDPETSHEWAAKVREGSRGKWISMMKAMHEHGPLTYSEITDVTGIRGTFTSTTLTRMERLGLVQRLVDDDGRKLTRNGAMLRELTPAGREVVS